MNEAAAFDVPQLYCGTGPLTTELAESNSARIRAGSPLVNCCATQAKLLDRERKEGYNSAKRQAASDVTAQPCEGFAVSSAERFEGEFTWKRAW